MFNVVRRTSQTPSAPLPRLSEWDPVSLMENLLRFEPFADVAPARRTNYEQSFAPRFDVKESKDAYLFTADLPGVREEDVEISLTGNRLCISGHRSQEEEREGDNYYMVERSYGSFCRNFTLPDSADTDGIKAWMKDGVLNLNLPKRVESQPRRVALNKGQGGDGSAATATPASTPTATTKKAQS
jgi:HSP20 family protein